MEDRAIFGPSAETELDGTPAFRFDYDVPVGRSGFLLRSPPFGQAIIGYSGRFWVARDSLDLMRFVVSADNLPASLRLDSDVTTTDYRSIPIGGSDFLLPERSVSEAKDVRGGQVRNVMTFENCREFVGESVLRFDGTETSPPPK